MSRIATRFGAVALLICSICSAQQQEPKTEINGPVDWTSETDIDGDGYTRIKSLAGSVTTQSGTWYDVYVIIMHCPTGTQAWDTANYVLNGPYDEIGPTSPLEFSIGVPTKPHAKYDYSFSVVDIFNLAEPIIGIMDYTENPALEAYGEENSTEDLPGAPAINSSLTANGNINEFFTYTITATGSSPMSFTASPLPDGLSLSGATISGFPTAGGLTNVQLTASNGVPPNDNETLQITIFQPTTATPVVSPNGGSFSGTQDVTLTCSTQNSAIRYTLDGSTPTKDFGTLYAGMFTLSSTTTVKAIAYCTGLADSQLAQVTFTQSKQNQTIDFAPIGSHTFGDPDITLIASASSGLPVTFSIVTGQAFVNGNQLTIIGAGNITVRAFQAGNGAYNSATQDQTFNVARAAQNLTFTPIADRSVAAPPFSVNASSTSQLAVTLSIFSGPATINGGTVTLTGSTGTVVVRAMQPGDANYLPATPVNEPFDVYAQTSQTITFDQPPDRVVSDPPFLLDATASSGLTVQFQVLAGPAIVTDSTVTLTGSTGLVTIRATQPGNVEFSAATAVIRSFNVNPKTSQSITFDPLPDRALGDPPFSLTATASSGLPVSFSILSGPATLSNGNRVTLTGMGTVSIRASQAGNTQYSAAPDIDQSFTVLPPANRAPTFVSAPTAAPNPVYAGDTVTLTAAGTDPDGDTITISVDWGDGTTNNLLTHIYVAAGTYTAIVTLRDPENLQTSQPVEITAKPPVPFVLTKLACKFSFAKPGNDSVQVAGFLEDMPIGLTFGGKTITVDTGGAVATILLDDKGAGKTQSGSFKFKAKLSKDKKFIGGNLPFQAVYKGNFVSKWADEGALPDLNTKSQTTTMFVGIQFNDERYGVLATPVILKSKAHVGGTFTKK